MAFPTTPIIDDFDRADEPLPNTACSDGINTWSASPINGGGSNALIISNAVGYTVGSSADLYIASSFGPDVEVYASWPSIPSAGNYVFLAARIKDEATAAWDGYGLIWINGGSPAWQIRRYDNGTQTNVVNTNGSNPVSGDKVGFSIIGDLLTGYLYTGGVWTSVLSGNDSTYAAAGKIGFEVADSTARMDDFGGGDYAPVVAGDDPNMAPPQLGGWGAC